MSNQGIKPSPVSRCGDDNIRLDTLPVGEKDVGPFESLHRGDNLDPSRLDCIDEAVVDRRPDTTLPNAR